MGDPVTTSRVLATPAAHQAVARLCADGGGIMFVQSGGCCAGSVPMCFPGGEYLVDDGERPIGYVDGNPFYIDPRLDDAWHQDVFVLDVAPGEAEGFSLPAGEGLRFVTRADRCSLAASASASRRSEEPHVGSPDVNLARP